MKTQLSTYIISANLWYLWSTWQHINIFLIAGWNIKIHTKNLHQFKKYTKMVQGSQDCKNKTTHNQGTPQTPVAKKPLILNNDMVPSMDTSTSSDTWTANYYKLIEEQQKVITSMQEEIHALEAKVYELEGQMSVTQTVNSHLQNMVDTQRSNTRVSHVLLLMAWQSLDTRKVLIIPMMWNKSLRL